LLAGRCSRLANSAVLKDARRNDFKSPGS